MSKVSFCMPVLEGVNSFHNTGTGVAPEFQAEGTSSQCPSACVVSLMLGVSVVPPDDES